jgi:hypothetical protein
LVSDSVFALIRDFISNARNPTLVDGKPVVWHNCGKPTKLTERHLVDSPQLREGCVALKAGTCVGMAEVDSRSQAFFEKCETDLSNSAVACMLAE